MTEEPKIFPYKEIILGGHFFKLHGLAADEQYFASINANFDTEFYALCRRLILPDYVCIDVGANIGVKSLFLSRHCSLGQVIAIEPAPIVARCLETNIAANGATNVRREQTAVGNTKGLIRFQDFSAWGHISEGGTEVPITTLEEIVGRLDLQRMDFIKIDVEGSEFSILQTSLDLINRFESLVLVELNAFAQLAFSKTNPRDFIDWILANFSYVFALNRNDSDELLAPISTKNCIGLLHRNMVRDGCVTDLLITNAPRRLVPSVAYLEEQLKTSTARFTALHVELNTARAERDAMATELNAERLKCDSLRKSGSWRVTTPLRWLRDKFQNG